MVKIIRFALSFSLLFLLVGTLAAEIQTVFLKNGKIAKGEVIQQNALMIRLKLPDGTIQEIQKSEIRRISFKAENANVRREQNPDSQKLEEEEQKRKADAAKKAEEESAKTSEEKRKKGSQNPISERHALEFFLGLGRSSYESQVGNFQRGVEQYSTILGNNGGFFYGQPKRENSSSQTGNLRYSWKKIVGDVGGSRYSSYESTQNFGNIVYPSGAVTITQDAYALNPSFHKETYKQIYAQISYSVYSRSIFEIRPIIGYQKIWQSGKDDSTYELSPRNTAFAGSFDWIIRNGTNFSDSLKGPSFGLAIESKWNQKWETRFELQKQILTGDSVFTRDQFALFSGFIFEARSALTNRWKADGLTVSGKLIYHWKNGIFFWTGFQYSKIDYKLQNFGGDLNFNGSAAQVYLSEKLVESLTQGLAGSSVAKGIFIGVGYSFDFKPKSTLD